MPSELETRMIHNFAEDISVKLNEAAVIARIASGLGANGLTDRAFITLLDIEVLIRDASVLLNAASIVIRRGRERETASD